MALAGAWQGAKVEGYGTSAEHKLFIGNLPEFTSPEDLKALFQGYGELKEAVLLPAKASNSDQRCGFVKFAQLQDATNAIQGLNGVEWGGSKLVVRMADGGGAKPAAPYVQPAATWGMAAYAAPMYAAQPAYAAPVGYGVAMPAFYPPVMPQMAMPQMAPMGPREGCKLFVGNIPATWNQDNLSTMFQVYGALEETVVLARRGFNDTQCGFVKFYDPQCAAMALRSLAGTQVEGSELVVRYADKGRGQGQGGPSRNVRGPNVPTWRPY